MRSRLVVQNTFIHAEGIEKTSSAAEGLVRTRSCPSFADASATPKGSAKSGGSSAVSPLAKLGVWADVDSDSEEEQHPACMSSVGLGSFGLTDKVNPAFKGGEKTASDEARTPLSGNAAAFVPFSPLSSKASEFRPRLPQMASESSDPLVRTPTNTTAIFKKLPTSCTRADLVQALNDTGFDGFYNFVYVPMDFESKKCLGYAFVNMTDEEKVQHLIEKMDGHRLVSLCTDAKPKPKPCKVTLSQTQGLAANINRYRNSPVMGSDVPELFKPALFVGSQQVPFPGPTRAVPPIRLRTHLQ